MGSLQLPAHTSWRHSRGGKRAGGHQGDAVSKLITGNDLVGSCVKMRLKKLTGALFDVELIRLPHERVAARRKLSELLQNLRQSAVAARYLFLPADAYGFFLRMSSGISQSKKFSSSVIQSTKSHACTCVYLCTYKQPRHHHRDGNTASRVDMIITSWNQVVSPGLCRINYCVF